MYSNLKQYFSSTSQPDTEPNLFTIIRPLYRVLSLFGLFPYSVKFNDTKKIFTIVPKSIYVNALCALSTMIMILAFLAAHVQYLFSASEHSSLSDALITQMNYVFELSTLTLYCIVAYICAFIYRSKYLEILNEMTSVFMELTDSTRRLGLLRSQTNMVMGILTILVLLQLCVNFTRTDSFWKMILVTFSFNFPQVVQMISLSFYYVLVMALVSVLTSINENLETCAIEKRNGSEAYIKVYERKSNTTVRQMELVYAKVVEIKRGINDAFQAPILMCTLQCFHSIVSEAYIIYHGVVVKSHTTHAIVNCSIWICYQFLKIYSLSYSGNLLKVEALKIGQSLHNIPTEKQDTRMFMEVQHFSSLMNCQGALMTVYGYFPLDATLMSTMIATATMYLIILVQFDRNNEEIELQQAKRRI